MPTISDSKRGPQNAFFLLSTGTIIATDTVMSHHELFKIENGEAELVDALNGYSVEHDAKLYKHIGGKQNWVHSGLFLYELVLMNGNFKALDVWYEKTLKGLTELKLEYDTEHQEHGDYAQYK